MKTKSITEHYCTHIYCKTCMDKGVKDAKEKVFEVISELNTKFRKENTPQILSDDEFNDLWEEELKKRIDEVL